MLLIIKEETAGSPTDVEVKWTHLHPREISQMYEQTYGVSISNRTIKRILREAGYRRRRPNKALAIGKSPHRSAQFRLIFYFATLFSEMENNPIISLDTKKLKIPQGGERVFRAIRQRKSSIVQRNPQSI